MERFPIFISAVFCILIGCKSESPKEERILEIAGPKYDTSKFAILPWIDPSYPFQGDDFKPTELTQRDLEIIDSLFLAKVKTYNQELILAGENSTREIDLTTSNYRRQLVAVENSNREKIVWVNCLCNPTSKWKTMIEVVDDGGSCYFNFKINLTRKTVNGFSVNGEA